MAFIEDLSTDTYCPWVHQGLPCFSVGWLGDSVPRTGVIPSRIFSVLHRYAAEHPYQDGFLGKHTCEICGSDAFHGEFWIELFDYNINHRVRFVLPLGIFHYIDAHGYCPPQEFLDAIESLELKLESDVA